jgi:GH15 family glucan-1,4-alpha-glucosidase
VSDVGQRIEDYALIGDTCTAALVGRDGSIDWLCLPRFDSPAVFARLLGTEENGFFRIAPAGGAGVVRRRYRDDTLVLETAFETDRGRVTLVDFMPPGDPRRPLRLVRLVRGDGGTVPMEATLAFRFGYGRTVPWVTRLDDGVRALAGPDLLRLRSPAPLRGRGFTTHATFTIRAGESVPFVLTWSPSYLEEAGRADPADLLAQTERYWRSWVDRATLDVGALRPHVVRSLITLKALTYGPTGGMVAAPTTSLPERIGGTRNWDYRYTWLRDATFVLYCLLASGYRDEAASWRAWLLRAVAGEPADLRILYGIAGERGVVERDVPWLPGYEGSAPVRIGNAAQSQLQLDVYGELMDVLLVAREHGLAASHHAWDVQRALMSHLESAWRRPDSGIWEVRSQPRHFTHSNVMAWVAFDRAIKTIERFGVDGPVAQWRATRDLIHHTVCERGFDRDRNAFMQSYGATDLDAALLLMPLVGFLTADDPRVMGTVEAIRRELVQDGFVMRYTTAPALDGLPGGEGAFLPCSFWLADVLARMGRRDEAWAIYERLLAVQNDVGLLAEEYDPHAKRALGNFPQAFSHVALVNTAHSLTSPATPVRTRGAGRTPGG